MDVRIECSALEKKVMSAEEAAALIQPDTVLGVSGFTLAGYPKKVPLALAKRALLGERLGLTVLSGASLGDEVDGTLARAGAVARRYPYQSNADLRNAVNAGTVAYTDIHLSHMPLWVKSGVFGHIDCAIIEAAGIDVHGNIIPTLSVGCSDSLAQAADRVIVEINTSVPLEIYGLHDVYTPKRAPNTQPIPLVKTPDRIGTPYIPCDSEKIAAVVYSDIPDTSSKFSPPDDTSRQIAVHLLSFLQREQKAGRLPEKMPPLQSGVGSIGNAILAALGDSELRGLEFYSEVLQTNILKLLDAGVVSCASGSSLSLSLADKERFFANLSWYRDKIILRPQEISNSPELIRRLGVISTNTAIEVDLSGNVNSTHINGARIMNGLGGSGDYTRNAQLSIFVTPSTAKNGAISCIVPYVSHVDHTEHDVDVIITEYGVADLRCLTAYERARKMIEIAAPQFRDDLSQYMDMVKKTATAYHGIPMLQKG